jgi:hypothetical protein
VVDRGISTNTYYSATGKFELIPGMRAGGIGGATQQWGGQLLRLGKLEYVNWTSRDGFDKEILAELEKETEFILKKLKTRIPKLNGYSVESPIATNISSSFSHLLKDKELSKVFGSTLDSPLFHYIEGLEISCIEGTPEHQLLRTNSGLVININQKILLLALGVVENTALLVRSIPNFSNHTYEKLGKNLQDHPHGILFEIESNIFTWYRNYTFFRLNTPSVKKKFEYTKQYGNHIRGGIAEVHPIEVTVTFRDEFSEAFAEKSLIKLVKFVLRVLSTISIKFIGKKLFFERADIWFQYEQEENDNSQLQVSRNKIIFDWRNSKEDFEFVSDALRGLKNFFTDLGFKVTNVRTWNNEEDLDKWSSEACHPSGTIPLGTDKSLGVADFFGKVHVIPRTYLLGSSLFPTAGWFNPTLLIMAYSRLVISKIEADQKIQTKNA